MKEGSPNHRMMAMALGIAWLSRWGGTTDRPTLARLERAVGLEGEDQVSAAGIWTFGRTSEQFAPDPHAAYWLLPALVFALHQPASAPWRDWWRGTAFAWQSAASPAGEVLLPCGRWAGRFSQVTDAIYRAIFDLPHRNNKFQTTSFATWAKKFEPLSGFAAAVEVEKIIRAGDGRLLGLGNMDTIEPPVLALPTTIRRTATGLTATMLPRPGINVTKAAWRVTADWTDQRKPAKWAVSLERPAESATEARRLRLEV
jgi:hypothetical protein